MALKVAADDVHGQMPNDLADEASMGDSIKELNRERPPDENEKDDER